MKNKQKIAGFTLIELLVVVVIIGILATISVSVYGNFINKAIDMRRVSNIKQITQILTIDRGIESEIVGGLFGRYGSRRGNLYLLASTHSNNTCLATNGNNDQWGNPCIEKLISKIPGLKNEKDACYVIIGDRVDRSEKRYNDFLIAIISAEDETQLFYDGTIRAKSFIDGVNEDKISFGKTLKEWLLSVTSNQRENGGIGCHRIGLNGLSWRTAVSDPDHIQFLASPFGTEIGL